VTENSTPNVKGSPESPTFIIEFYVKASDAHLETASRRVLGDDMVWKEEKFGFSATIVIEDCPLQLLFYRVEESTYYVLSDSTCNIDDCPNINRCLERDARIFDKFKRRILEIAGKSAIIKLKKKTDWRPEHIQKDISSSLIMKALSKKESS
jgi:hypothetical protein